MFLLGTFVLPGFCEGQQEATEESLKMGALLPGVVNDCGRNTLMYNSLKHQEDVFGAKIGFPERTPSGDYEEIFRVYAEEGNDIELRSHVLTSVTEDMPKGHEVIIRDILEGNFTPKNYLIGFERGAINLSSFHEKEKRIQQRADGHYYGCNRGLEKRFFRYRSI